MGATKVSADEGIKDLEPSKRNCLFYDEMKLNFHQNYTRANCLLECAMEFAMAKVLGVKCNKSNITKSYMHNQN